MFYLLIVYIYMCVETEENVKEMVSLESLNSHSQAW